MGKIRRTYSQEFKYEVVKMYLEERWVRAFREMAAASIINASIG